MTGVWFIASGNPGTSSFLETGTAAVDFYVRADAAGLSVDQIKAAAAGRYEQWDEAAPATRTRFAGQLAQFASQIDVGDQVITFDGARRSVVFVGRVLSEYRYEDPAAIPDHPHARDVEWLGLITRDEMVDGGAAIPSTPGITVRHVYDTPIQPTAELDDAPAFTPSSGRPGRRPAAPRVADHFTWEPLEGGHRYVLRQTFGGERSMERPLLVVMLNPAANHVAGYARSTTCHAVRRWAQKHGHDGAVYVNLFSHIEPNSTLLRSVPTAELNGPDADRMIAEVARAVDGPAVAGWGALPPGFSRALYDRRVAEVERLIGRPLMCLGFTQSGYPRHGRRWLEDDVLVPLRSM